MYRPWCHDAPHSAHGAGRGGFGWGFDPSGGAWFGGGRGRPRGGPYRRGRVFEQGDLKYVVLKLLAEKPRHGYEIIKELEERFGGTYAPSAGTVYPTLALLEDLGYASVTLEEGGKKVYVITPAGTKYLEENRDAVEDIFERIADIGASVFGEAMGEVNKAFGRLARATYTTAPWHTKDKDVVDAIRKALDEATTRIEEVARGKRPG
jgi:DNA-binding PadR family transcriptional regulator